ncbi:MAG: RDD family protein [Candidatus Aenigmatarchaeota archaeon]
MPKLVRVGFAIRFAAFIVDSIFLFSVGFAAGMFGAVVPDLTNVLVIASIPASIAYFVLLEGWCGQTIGKKVVGISVVTERGKPIGYAKALVRRIGLLIPVFSIIDALAILRESRQRLFDQVAGTIVVRRR